MSPEAQAARRASPAATKAGIIAAILGGILAVCVCAGICSNALGGHGNAGAPQTAQQQQSSATNTPAKPACPASTQARALGGTECDFMAKYGQPTSSGNNQMIYNLVGTGSAIQGMQFTLTVTFGDGHAQVITVAPDNGGTKWIDSGYLIVLTKYLPADATYLKNRHTADGSTEMVYKSKLLASEFPATVFTNADTGSTVAAGTLSVSVDSNDTIISYALGM